jgi:chemotaxis protein methyltransferase CheR
MNAESFGRLKLLADRVTGQHLFSEKTYLYASRLAKLVQTSGFQDVDQFVMAVTNQSHVGHELKLVSALLDTGTRFFEDRQQLANMIAFLATRSACKPAPEPLRIWCAGVSTGQEAYSLVILLSELSPEMAGCTEIVATDFSERAIEAARSGRFGHYDIQLGLSVHRMLRHFQRVGERDWQIDSSMRKRVSFRQHNLLDELPGEETFDAVICRRVLSGMTSRARPIALHHIAQRLKPGGLLLLARGERIESPSRLFSLATEISPCAWKRCEHTIDEA